MLTQLQDVRVPLFLRNCDIADKASSSLKEGVDYSYDEEKQISDHTLYMGMTGYTTRNSDGNEDFQKTDNSWITPDHGPQ